MAKICAFCNNTINWPDINSCYYCKNNYCNDHRIAENHDCPKAMAAKHIEKDYLRRKGVNITTGRFKVICKNCGDVSDYFPIEQANLLRIEHIKFLKCSSDDVVLSQHEEDKKDDEYFVKTYDTSIPTLDTEEIESEEQIVQNESNSSVPQWMYDCLNEAQYIINTHHKDEKDFFSTSRFNLFIQREHQYFYGFIDGTGGDYNIGIHEALSTNEAQNPKMVTILLVHELLHAIHADWDERKVQSEESILANKAGFFDALHEFEILYLSGKMRFCDK